MHADTIVRSDSAVRMNVSLALLHARSAYSLYLHAPDVMPPPIAKRLREALNLLDEVHDALEYAFQQSMRELRKELKKVTRKRTIVKRKKR